MRIDASMRGGRSAIYALLIPGFVFYIGNVIHSMGVILQQLDCADLPTTSSMIAFSGYKMIFAEGNQG